MPLARLQLRLPTREGELNNLSHLGKVKTTGTSVSPDRARLNLLIIDIRRIPSLSYAPASQH